MRPSPRSRAWIRQHVQSSSAVVAAAIVVAGGLILSVSSSQAFSRVVTMHEAASKACATYVFHATAEVYHVNPPTIIGAYPTTAGNLESWIHTVDPMGDPAVLQALSPSANVTDCLLHWNGDDNYEAVVVAPDGTGTPILSGPSTIANSAPADSGS